MKKIFFLVCVLAIIFQPAFAYHEERERMQEIEMTGLFSQDDQFVMFPLAGKEYRLQIPIQREQYENTTLKVGYGYFFSEPIYDKITKEPSGKKQSQSQNDSIVIDTSEFVLPLKVNFTVSFEKAGSYGYNYFESKLGPSEGWGGSSSGGGLFVVEKYSKAVHENGKCKNPELLTLAKHDFSKLVCVSQHAHHELITRGWAPLPG